MSTRKVTNKPIKKPMKTYVFHVKIEKEEDGRYSAWIPALPGCASWGNSEEEALENIQDALKAYIATLLEEGRPLPAPNKEVQVINAPAVSVAI